MRTWLLPLLCVVLGASCTEDGVPRDPNGTDPGVLPDGGGANPSPMEGCPDSQPKVGENCTPGVTESNRCEFITGECTAPNGTNYVESIVFCCTTGVWETCGGKSPCDNMQVDAAEPLPDGGAPDANPDAFEVRPEVGAD
jgi:hypothetical protein